MTRAKRRRRRLMAKHRAAIQTARDDDWNVEVPQEARDIEKFNQGPEWPRTHMETAK